jgi:hypothetical protein
LLHRAPDLHEELLGLLERIGREIPMEILEDR